jgi:hypothetical protein
MLGSETLYYDVTVTKTVKALTQADAISLATTSKARVPGEVLATFVDADRIPASEAHQLSLSANS